MWFRVTMDHRVPLLLPLFECSIDHEGMAGGSVAKSILPFILDDWMDGWYEWKNHIDGSAPKMKLAGHMRKMGLVNDLQCRLRFMVINGG